MSSNAHAERESSTTKAPPIGGAAPTSAPLSEAPAPGAGAGSGLTPASTEQIAPLMAHWADGAGQTAGAETRRSGRKP